MSFNEKLQKLRKEKKYSQEELADKLEITRQSVSKWESGQTYPEMDKLLAICKIFNCTLEELTNDEIKEIDVSTKKASHNIIDNISEFANKTYNMFINMDAKAIFKCIITMLIVAFLLTLVAIPGRWLGRLFYELIVSATGSGNVGMRFAGFISALFNLVIALVYATVFILLFLLFFKIVFLDKFDEAKIKEKPVKETHHDEEELKEKLQKEEVIEDKFIKKESIITKDYSIFKNLGLILMFFVKAFLVVLSLPFMTLMILLFACLALSIYLITQGIVLISILILIISAIILNTILLEFIGNVLFNKEHGYKRLLVSFLIGIAGIGVASGIFVFEVSRFEFRETPHAELERIVERIEFEVTDDIFFGFSTNNIEYIIDNEIDNIIIEFNYHEDFVHISQHRLNGGFQFFNNHRWPLPQYFNILLESLRNRVLFEANYLFRVDVRIYASAENIELMQENERIYNELREEEWRNHEYHNQITHELEREIDRLQHKLWMSEEKNNQLEEQIWELEAELQELRDRVNSILN